MVDGSGFGVRPQSISQPFSRCVALENPLLIPELQFLHMAHVLNKMALE